MSFLDQETPHFSLHVDIKLLDGRQKLYSSSSLQFMTSLNHIWSVGSILKWWACQQLNDQTHFWNGLNCNRIDNLWIIVKSCIPSRKLTKRWALTLLIKRFDKHLARIIPEGWFCSFENPVVNVRVPKEHLTKHKWGSLFVFKVVIILWLCADERKSTINCNFYTSYLFLKFSENVRCIIFLFHIMNGQKLI